MKWNFRSEHEWKYSNYIKNYDDKYRDYSLRYLYFVWRHKIIRIFTHTHTQSIQCLNYKGRRNRCVHLWRIFRTYYIPVIDLFYSISLSFSIFLKTSRPHHGCICRDNGIRNDENTSNLFSSVRIIRIARNTQRVTVAEAKR